MGRTFSTDARKKDTRDKIELGGLIVKAGLRYEKRALLLGLLIDGGRRIKNDEQERGPQRPADRGEREHRAEGRLGPLSGGPKVGSRLA